MSGLSLIALTMVLASCWTPSKARVGTGAEARTESAESRFLRVVTEGGSLYGLGRGCDEWVVTEMPERNTHGALAVGRITTRYFDAEGFFIHLDYAVGGEKGFLKAKIMSRGSRSPAPWNRANGSGSYCSEFVEITTDPRGSDWILVGEEAWYFSRESCERQPHRALVKGGCSAR